MQMRDAFARAYKDGQWHNGSGSGSSPANTTAYREFLQGYMKGAGVRSVLDVGCGDWQFSRLIDWRGIAYTGVDVVPELIIRNTLRFGSASVSFGVEDVLRHGADGERLPPFDLILVKDLLQHWPDAAIHDLGQLLAGRQVLLTYDLGGGPHTDIAAGGYRPLDLTRAPFSWPAAERLRYESVSHEGTVRRVKVVAELAP
jgi:SAM-dependent methyltransferase